MDYKLTDLLGAAGSTIGIIIAGAIFLQFLTTRYLDISGRFRALTGECRQGELSGPREASLQTQIRLYRKRLQLVNWASWLGAGALLLFLLTLICGGLSLIWPEQSVLKVGGTAGLFLGLGSILAAVVIHLIESVIARHEIAEEDTVLR